MNKKVFTLLAASLMLFTAAFSANAQGPKLGDTVKYLPDGIGKGAYHLAISHIGDRKLTGDSVLVMDEFGYLTMKAPEKSWYNVGEDSSYTNLRRALWCVNVSARELQGNYPAYTFINKEYNTELAFKYNWSEFSDKNYEDSIFTKGGIGDKHIAGQTDLPLIGGDKAKWRFSYTYNTVPLDSDVYLAIEVEPDYYMTFAVPDSGKGGKLRLVVAHRNEFDPRTDFYKKNLVRFTLLQAAPRVLNAKDFNTMLRQNSAEDYIQMAFYPNVTAGQANPFDQPLKATSAGASGYLRLQNKAGQYVTMLDGADANNYVNVYGIKYPKLTTTANPAGSGESDWRVVYYPSEDSLVINVRTISGHPDYGSHTDIGTYQPGAYDGLFNQDIWNYLTVRMQDLNASERVLTVANKPANIRMSFGANSCQLFDANRTTIPTNLYTVQDREGRYLVVPLYAGSFTPQWMYLDENENALKTPADQWYVEQVNETSATSKIYLTNREFDNIRIEYVQIYKNYELFKGVWSRVDTLNKAADYSPVMGKNYVREDGFKVVPAPYRNNPFLGYQSFDNESMWYKSDKEQGAAVEDSLNWWGYKFKYLSGLSDAYYMGVSEDQDPDTTIFVLKEDPTYFQLVLPDSLRSLAYGGEKYGIGWNTARPLAAKFTNPAKKDDYIAPLKRYFYYLQINDYKKFVKNENFVVMDDNARYGYTKETVANSRKLNKAKFYLRFTYDVNGTDYYTLLDRIDLANFHYLTRTLGLNITDTLKVYDTSHGTITQNSFGVVQAAVDDKNLYVRAQVKTTGANRVSAFALGSESDPLYRRFNTLDEGSVASDAPDTVKFFRTNNPTDYLYEDAHSIYSLVKPVNNHGGVNFLGVENEASCIDKGKKDPVHLQHQASDWAIYVDTAYVNRGTGWIKPQYMLVVGPEWIKLACTSCGETDILDGSYLYGRFLRNETDSARKDPNNVNSDVRDKDYIWNGKWERLAFTPAIHWNDTLYVLNGRESAVKNPDGTFNYKKLRTDAFIKRVPLGNNLHKDEVFSFRFTEVGGGADKDFLIESETTNRNAHNGRMIAPMQGGWVKVQNGVPTISRGSYADAINEAEIWNVKKTNKAPVANQAVSATDVAVVAGAGQVIVLNAAGKQVVVSNILGQAIANVVLTSDNQAIAAPQGVVVVAIEGENAVKAVVK